MIIPFLGPPMVTSHFCNCHGTPRQGEVAELAAAASQAGPGGTPSIIFGGMIMVDLSVKHIGYW